ncbi:MAG: penicillin-binding protein 1C [Halothermotrichaceae bacterium]
MVFTLIILIMGGIFWVVKLPDPLFLQDYSTVILDENDNYLRLFLNDNQQWYFPPDDTKIPYKLKKAVINYEDKRFYSHSGIDFFALGRALYQNVKAGKIISGASTITMQVARISRSKDRTISNKLIEMIHSVKLEMKYSKNDILELYFSHAPYGGNIIGYKAASYRYFGKPPGEISWGEAALLAVLPNSPGLINPMKGRKKLLEKRNALLQDLYVNEVINKQTLKLALAEPIPEEQISFELTAPLLARDLKNNYQDDIIRTTISADIQDSVCKMIDEYMINMKAKGIMNCSVLVADTKTGAVKAYIGSNDFYDMENSGRIDGIQMKRSPGSVLKPFLYGLAMDEGLIVPESKLKDIPVAYGSYIPYNNDGSFRGMVTTEKALIESLNAPAVNLLAQYGVSDFYKFLKEAGVEGLGDSADRYGLPLILGGAEISLWDIASLYNSLGNYGEFSKLHVIEKPVDVLEIASTEKTAGNYGNPIRQNSAGKFELYNKEQQLISKGSSYLLLDIMKEVKRPGLEYYWEKYAGRKKIAWKTGTSYGNRDAWAVGVSPEWTIAVWTGNFNGNEDKSLTGIDAAAPLLFRIFNSLDTGTYSKWFKEPEDMKKIKVSAVTGYRLKEKLGEQVKVDAPASAKSLRYSPYEKKVFLNIQENREVCSLCWEAGKVKEAYQVVYPPDVISYLKERGNDYTIPPHEESCPSLGSYKPIDFVYPQDGSVIEIPRGMEGKYQKVKFKIAHSHDKSNLYWYLDNNYLGQTNDIHQKLLSPKTGWHTLYVMDDQGYSCEISFYAKRKGDTN